MEHRAPCKTYPQSVGWIKRYEKNLNMVIKKSEYGHAAYQIKGKEV